MKITRLMSPLVYKEQGPECGNQLDWNTIKFDLEKDITEIKITM